MSLSVRHQSERTTPKPPIYEQVHAVAVDKCKPFVERYNLETDPKKRIDLRHKIGRVFMRTYSLQILKLSEADWNRYCKERFELVNQARDSIAKEYLDSKLARGEIKLDDLELLAYEGEKVERFGGFRLSKAERKSISQFRIRERTSVLLLLDTLQFYLTIQAMGMALEPLSQINALVARRFGSDQNWVLAAAILATHENLVKRKLADLGVSDEEVERASKAGGLYPLIDMLERQILAKDKRQVSLEFYRASALRNIRNVLEHQGYNLKVSQGEMLDLLHDIQRFEKELYKS
jgi:hypothetical protein